ncbi:MAG: DUF4869 domain-containing protein [Lachnospiraceae bacterium]|nr:DUF4869 domain-containing protein [Lachnospiraceae bacterium]
MLKVYFGDMEDSIYNTSVRFDNNYEDSWINSAIAKEIIKDIDNSEVLSANCIKSEVLGQISPTMLSGGTKTLLLIINEPTEIFNASTCGDNCAKWILKISENKDVIINLRHIMDFGRENFTLEVLNNNKIVHSMKELLPYASEYLR